MNKRRAILPRWQDMSIANKFSSAFGLLLALIVLVSITSYAALTIVRRETETAILTSTGIQRVVLEMDRGLQEARVLQRDFFLRYPTVGLAEARQYYALESVQKMAEVVTLSKDLRQRISESNVSDALQETDVDLNLYLSAAERYADTFLESVELVTQLAAPDTGLEAQLTTNSALLRDILQSSDYSLIGLYQDMQAFEKDYEVTRQRPSMQSAFNVAFQLRRAIEDTPTLEAEQKAQALTYLDNYQSIAEEIIELDVAIQSKLRDFDLQAEAVNPISAELITLANGEVERAQARIDQINQLATVILFVTALAGLSLAIFIIRMLNNSITRNVVRLTQTAGELQAGNLDLYAQIDSTDELGQLAASFNSMTARINTLVGSLEQRVAERTADLEHRAMQLTTAAEVSRAASSTLNIERLLSQTVELIAGRFNLYYTGLFLIDEAGKWAVLQAGTGQAGQQMLAQGHRLKVGGTSMVGWCTANSQARIALDVGDEAVRFDNPLLPDTRSEMALPLSSRGRVIGALDVQSTEAAAFTKEDIEVLQTMADQLANAIDNARLFQQAQESLEAERRAYSEFSRQAWEELLRTQPDLGQRYDPDGILPTDGRWREEMKLAVLRGETILGRTSPPPSDGTEAGVTLATPIKVRDHIIGVLNAHKPVGAGRWTPEEITLVETLTNQLGTALESARLYRDTQRHAARERLTRQITDEIRRATNAEAVVHTAVDALFSVLGTSRAFGQLEAAPPARDTE
jgi:GAF domain-containing protein/HAMP domain-containing protein